MTSDTYTNNERYDSINGLRAYAAIGIILMHVYTNMPIKPTFSFFTQSLIYALADFTLLFMIISGFSICCGYYLKLKNGNITLNNFYKKRYFRILPFFGFLCILDLILHPQIEYFYQVFFNLTLCFKLLPTYQIEVIGVSWFLGIVFLFYMLFPFFIFLTDNKRRAWLSLIVCYIFVFIAMNASFIDEKINRLNFVYCIPFFMSGCIIYLYKGNIKKSMYDKYYLSYIFMIILSYIYILLREIHKPTYITYTTELLFFSFWLIYAISCPNNIILNNRIVNYLSKISMEIYLSHMVIFRIIERLHIENYIHNANLAYFITFLLTICGVICFVNITKSIIINKIDSYIKNNHQ